MLHTVLSISIQQDGLTGEGNVLAPHYGTDEMCMSEYSSTRPAYTFFFSKGG
jgi:hypothetical protein